MQVGVGAADFRLRRSAGPRRPVRPRSRRRASRPSRTVRMVKEGMSMFTNRPNFFSNRRDAETQRNRGTGDGKQSTQSGVFSAARRLGGENLADLHLAFDDFGDLEIAGAGLRAHWRAPSWLPSGGTGTSSRRVAAAPAANSTCAMGSTPAVSISLSLSKWSRMPLRSAVEARGFGIGNVQIGQCGHVTNFLFGDFHARAFFLDAR